MDAQGRVTAWTPAVGRLLGHDEEGIVGRPAAELFAGGPPAPLLRSFSAGREWCGRAELRHRDGHHVEADVHVTPLLGGRADAAWMVVVAEAGRPDDATKATDPAGSAETATLRGWALAQLPMPHGVFDRRNRLVAANDEACRAMAVREDGTLGRRLGQIHSRPPYNRLEELSAQVLRSGEAVTARIADRATGDRQTRVWSNVVYPLTDAEGQVRGTSIVVLNVTEEESARRRLSLVNTAGLRVGTTLDVTRTAEELAEVATEWFADFVGVDLHESVLRGLPPESVTGGTAYYRVAQRSVLDGCPEAATPTGRADHIADDSPMGLALTTGRVLRHRIDAPEMVRWLAREPARAQRAREYGIHSYLVAPLRARGATLGLVIFLRHRTPDPFRMDDLHLATELAARAALSLDNARQYTRERNTALALQHSMLPERTPQQAAVDVAFRYLPGRSQEGAGGDWFDVIPLPGARVALVVGDVVGHGIHASATMGRLRTAVRTLADLDIAPDELLTHLDDLVLRVEGEQSGPAGERSRGPGASEVGATCLYAVYDSVSRRCTLARAGHPGPAVLRPDGVLDFPQLPAGPPLGLGGLPFESTELELAEGSLLALYTKGLVEAVDRDTGLAPLRHALADPAPTLEEICDDVLDVSCAVDPMGDVALLLARTRALDGSQVADWDLSPELTEVSRARKLAMRQLGSWGLEETSFVTELVVSELVTNAIRYGRPPIRLRLIRNDAGLVCEVSDGSSTAPHLRRARVYDEGGRGLLLVARLSERWGTRHEPHGKTIWAEQRPTAAG
ncbi:SpoIIE family protein phosphatase [Streptomyces sp. NBC_01669]|uniref:SpoIIE family protein phosphatase n=1 Tax=Streptomyces sp. NBC_01669 TaxID=2975909 RepID=UPI00224D93AF|nr:SpoIIE family protein phosphatase [Streptomyces sp. NBC_01669]MCX4530879.1 PAS domain-containing SpoIIE family protein phosphatase/ATP-binding protein [Streptomyces sp. NBC_01669]